MGAQRGHVKGFKLRGSILPGVFEHPTLQLYSNYRRVINIYFIPPPSGPGTMRMSSFYLSEPTLGSGGVWTTVNTKSKSSNLTTRLIRSCFRRDIVKGPPAMMLISASRKAFSKAAAPLESGPMLSTTTARRRGTCTFHRGTTTKDEWRAWDLRRPAAWAGRLGSFQSRPALAAWPPLG